MAPSISRILRTLSRDEAFYFFVSIGNYTGESAASLQEFLKKIGEVNIKSLEFHLYRRDFEKWVNEVLGDAKLAAQISDVQSLSLTGDSLQSQLYLVVSRRYEELKSGLSETR